MKKIEIFIIAAVSADGFIARNHTESSTSWTSQEDTQFFISTTKKANVVVYGAKTFNTIPKQFRPLKDRLNIVYTNSPQSFSEYDSQKLQATNKAPKELIQSLVGQGYESVAICGGKSIYSLFMSSGVVTKLYLTIEPVLFGDGIRLFDTHLDQGLELHQVHNLSKNTIVLEYNVA